MVETLLQRLLEARHFSLDGDDAHFERITKATTQLRADLLARRPDIVPAVLLGLDPEAPDDDPLFDAAESALKVEWKTLRNHYTERPRTILQAMLLDACSQAAFAEPRCAAIAWLTAVDAVPMFSPTPIHAVLQDHWSELGRVTETLALGVRPTVRAEPAKAPAKPAFKLQPREREPHPSQHYYSEVLQATGPFGGGAQQNPHQPSQPHHWAIEFAKRMSTTLVKVEEVGVDLAETAIAEAFSRLEQQVDTALTAMGNYLRDAAAAQAARVEARYAQQDALWWSQALYSPSLRMSYRQLVPEAAAVAMALDLGAMLEAPAPASIVHLLGETVARLPGAGHAQADRRPVGAIVDGLVQHGGAARGAVKPRVNVRGRSSLLLFVEEVVQGRKVDGLLHARTGISPDVSIGLPSFAMALFRAAQARALTEVA